MVQLVTDGARPGAGTPALLIEYAGLAARQLRATAPPTTSLSGLMAAYHMGWADRHGRPEEAAPGKLVRPSLCLWACEATGPGPEPALSLASAIEWVHNSTLVHDDIQDGDRARRHRETVWSIWGAGQGINAGDSMLAVAFELVTAPGPQGARRLRAGQALAAALRAVLEGQCQDLAQEGRLTVRPASYLRIARAKTGALLGASLEGGAIMGGGGAIVAGRLRRAGELLGLAFQVRDDWLGIWGRPELTGKSRDGDLGRRKVTYPVAAGYGAMAPAQRRRFRALFQEGAVPETRAMLEEIEADQMTATTAERYALEAVGLASSCNLPAAAAGQFEELAQYVANRHR